MIETTVNVRRLFDRFDRVKRRDQRRVFSDARKPLRADLRDHAKNQAEPDGRWPGLAATTVARRAQGKKRHRRRLLGRLPYAIAIQSGPTFVRAVSRARWSNVHQRGGTAGHGARIPRREFMWASRKPVREVRTMLKAAIMAAWKGR